MSPSASGPDGVSTGMLDRVCAGSARGSGRSRSGMKRT